MKKKISSILLLLFIFITFITPHVMANSSLPGIAFTYSSPINANINQQYLYGKKRSDGWAHVGIDYPAPTGTNVGAAQRGVVVAAAYNSAYGNYIIINHPDDNWRYWTLYAHLNSISVKVGDEPNKGDVIGKSGNTGNSSGPHLHFEVRYRENTYGSTLNPEVLLARSRQSPRGAIYGFVSNRSNGSAIENVIIDGLVKDSSVAPSNRPFINLHTYVKAKGYGQMRDVTDFSMNYCTGQLTSGSYWVEYSHPSYYSFLDYISIASGGVIKRDVELRLK